MSILESHTSKLFTFKVLSVESLVSEIGGSLGLFLGFSFLTLWDAVEFLGNILGKLSLNH